MATTRERLAEFAGDTVRTLTLDVNGGSTIYKGTIVCLDANGDAVAGGTIASGALKAAGCAQSTVDNSAGSDGDKDVQVLCGVYKFRNSSGSAIDDSHVGGPCYVEDNDTVRAASGGAYPCAGRVVQVDADGVRVLMSPQASESGASIQKRSVTIGHADLTAAATTETENLGAPLPAGSTVLGVNILLPTGFSGITGPVTVDIGSAGDVDALVDGANLATAVDGNASTRPLGIAPNKYFASSTQLIATFLSASGNLVDASAGECTIEVYFTVGA
jgi:hypothetical protein